MIVEEDRLADDLGGCLGRYWCGEGVAGGQIVLMGALLDGNRLNRLSGVVDCVGCDVDGGMVDFDDGCTAEEMKQFMLSLPRDLHLDKYRSRDKQSGASDDKTMREPIAIIEEQDEDEDDQEQHTDKQQHSSQEATEDGLVNAWQYRKSIQDARSGMNGSTSNELSAAGNIYCHSFDLSRRMWDQFSDEESNPLITRVKIVDCICGNNKDYRMQGLHLFKSIWQHIQSTLFNYAPTVIRLFLRRLPVAPGSVALPLLMAKIRQENLPVVVLTTIRPWRFLSSSTSNNKLDTLSSLRNAADTIFALDSFSSFQSPPPPEFSLLQGILTVRKCASFTASHYTDTICFKTRPLAERFGIKRDGRKVTVQLLHLPPEEYSRGGSSTEGVRSGGGQVAEGGGCSSSKLGGTSDW